MNNKEVKQIKKSQVFLTPLTKTMPVRQSLQLTTLSHTKLTVLTGI